MKDLQESKGPFLRKKLTTLASYEILDNWEYQRDMMYEPLVERNFAGEDEKEIPIDRDGNFYENFAWDESDVIHRLLNMDDNRVKPTKFKMKEHD